MPGRRLPAQFIRTVARRPIPINETARFADDVPWSPSRNSMRARRAVVFRISILCLVFELFHARAQVSPPNTFKKPPGVDVRTHKFRPGISPDRVTTNAAGAETHSEVAIDVTAARQINALLQDKRTRTAAQKK